MKRKRNTMKRKRNTMKRKRNTKLRFTKRMGGAFHPGAGNAAAGALNHSFMAGSTVIYENKEYILIDDLVPGGMAWMNSKDGKEPPIMVDTLEEKVMAVLPAEQ